MKEKKTMTKKELLISEITEIPEPLLTELLDFLHFLKMKMPSANPILSESSLKKDWLTPEEDKAWQSL